MDCEHFNAPSTVSCDYDVFAFILVQIRGTLNPIRPHSVSYSVIIIIQYSNNMYWLELSYHNSTKNDRNNVVGMIIGKTKH